MTSCGCTPAKPGGCPSALADVSRTMRRQATTWEAVSTVCAIIAQAFVSSIFAASIGAPFLLVSTFITTMLGGCEARGITQSAARQAASAIGLVLPVLSFVPGASMLTPILRPVVAVLSAYGAGRSPSSSDVGALAAAGAAAAGGDSPITPQRAQAIAAAAATALGASSSGGNVVSRVFRPSNNLIKADAFRLAMNGDPSSPLRDVGALASVLLSAAQVTAEVRGPRFDLRPDLTRECARILDDVAAYRVQVGMVAAQKKWDAITKTTRAYLEDVLRSPMPSPWSLAAVVEVLNDPTGAVSPIDGGDRVPVVDVIDRRGPSGGGGGGGAALGLGVFALLALAGGR